MSSRYAYCTFCDDIRFEVSSKLTLVGIYGGFLNIDRIPALLTKLCIVTTFDFPFNETCKSVIVRVFHDDLQIQEVTAPPEFLEASQASIHALSNPADPIQRITMNFHSIISPLQIERESFLKVVVVADDEEYIAGKLRIRNQLELAAQASATQAAAP
jgi:hypothetical protein